MQRFLVVILIFISFSSASEMTGKLTWILENTNDIWNKFVNTTIVGQPYYWEVNTTAIDAMRCNKCEFPVQMILTNSSFEMFIPRTHTKFSFNFTEEEAWLLFNHRGFWFHSEKNIEVHINKKYWHDKLYLKGWSEIFGDY